MRIAPNQPAGHSPDTSLNEVFSAASEAQICRIVLGVKVHGLEGLLQRA